MNDLLKRSISPVTTAAWRELDRFAASVFKGILTARTLVDFSGPHGWEFAAVNLGRLEVRSNDESQGVPWGVRTVQQLIELRLPFRLAQMELDCIDRGCATPDFGPVQQAVEQVAHFEERAIYHGFEAGQIRGIVSEAAHEPVSLPDNVEHYPGAMAEALKKLQLAGVEGPYNIILGPQQYYAFMNAIRPGYPPHRVVHHLLAGGDILVSPVLNGGVLLSSRGGDFEFTSGTDLSIGYASCDRQSVELFITESFTFRVLEPTAAVELKVG